MFTSIDDVKKVINRNLSFVEEFETYALGTKDTNSALHAIELVGMLYSELVTGRYSSDILEKRINSIAKGITFRRERDRKANEILIVMTESAIVGGHSVIANNWIRWDSKNIYSVVFTKNVERDSIPSFISEAVSISGGNIYILEGDYLTRATQLLEISQDYYRILLLQHMNDIVPNLAYSNPNWDTPVYMYIHANFKFSYGFSISDVNLNLCEYDVIKTSRYRGIPDDRNVKLQFPNQGNIVRDERVNKINLEKNEIIKKYGINDERKLVVSMGANWKFGYAIGNDFVEFAYKLVMGKHKVQFLVIGADTLEERWQVIEKRTNGNVRALGILNRAEAEMLISMADLYVVSFPMIASGRYTAIKYGTPYIGYDLIGRSQEYNEINMAKTEEELLAKAYAILDGNKNEFMGSNKNIQNRNVWLEEWENIYTKNNNHTVHTFIPNRMIDTEEIINCQLMQRMGIENIKLYLADKCYSKHMWNVIYNIAEQNNMECMPDEYMILDMEQNLKYKSLYKKCDKLYQYVSRWFMLKNQGFSIAEYLQEQGYKKIVVYGYSNIGKILIKELEGKHVEICAIIDKSTQIINNGQYQILSNLNRIEGYDIVINTTVYSNDEICKSQGCRCDMVSIFDIIDEQYNIYV